MGKGWWELGKSRGGVRGCLVRGWTRNASRDCVEDVYLRVIAHGYPRSWPLRRFVTIEVSSPFFIPFDPHLSFFLYHLTRRKLCVEWKWILDWRMNITIEFFFPLILLLTITQISKEIFLLLRTYTIHVYAFKRSVSFWKLKFATSSRDSLEQLTEFRTKAS